MGIFDAIKSAVFVEDPSAPSKVVPAKAVMAGTVGMTGISTAPLTTGVNPEFVAAIKKTVYGRNTPLTQLMSAADKMTAFIPDPATRLKAAFASAGDGRTVQQIIALSLEGFYPE